MCGKSISESVQNEQWNYGHCQTFLDSSSVAEPREGQNSEGCILAENNLNNTVKKVFCCVKWPLPFTMEKRCKQIK